MTKGRFSVININTYIVNFRIILKSLKNNLIYHCIHLVLLPTSRFPRTLLVSYFYTKGVNKYMPTIDPKGVLN